MRRYRMLAFVTIAQIGTALVQQGLGSLGPAISVAFDLSKSQFGIVLGLLLFGSAMATTLAGIAVDLYGERRVMALGGLVMGIALVMAGIVPAYWWMLIWITLAGAGYASSTPSGGRAILLWFRGDRGFAMGIRQMGVPIGGIIGALLLPAIAVASNYRVALMAGGVLTMLLTAIGVGLYRAPEDELRRERSMASVLQGMREVARDPRTLLVTATTIILVCGQNCMLAFFTLTLVTDVHLSIAIAASSLALAQVGACLARFVWGALSDRVFGGDRMLPMAIAALVTATSALAVAHLRPGDAGFVACVAFVLGFGAAGWNGLNTAAQVEIAGPDRAGSALGLTLTVVFSVGIVAAPLFGVIADTHGLPAAWTALGVVSVFGVVPALAARRVIRAGTNGYPRR
ncbi:MAG TPA: MFS transporter [Candidatus Baltobacteraceae bacterium]